MHARSCERASRGSTRQHEWHRTAVCAGRLGSLMRRVWSSWILCAIDYSTWVRDEQRRSDIAVRNRFASSHAAARRRLRRRGVAARRSKDFVEPDTTSIGHGRGVGGGCDDAHGGRMLGTALIVRSWPRCLCGPCALAAQAWGGGRDAVENRGGDQEARRIGSHKERRVDRESLARVRSRDGRGLGSDRARTA